MSRDTDQQLRLAQKMLDLVEQANKRICVTLLWYNVEKLESSFAQVRLFAKKKVEDNF